MTWISGDLRWDGWGGGVGVRMGHGLLFRNGGNWGRGGRLKAWRTWVLLYLDGEQIYSENTANAPLPQQHPRQRMELLQLARLQVPPLEQTTHRPTPRTDFCFRRIHILRIPEEVNAQSHNRMDIPFQWNLASLL